MITFFFWLIKHQVTVLHRDIYKWQQIITLIFTIRYIPETYIITFLFYEVHTQPNTPHGGGMSTSLAFCKGERRYK